ncbi:MAG: metallophosphoesterase [Sutterellaceae bacterium]|nr:metallophosphoesterase [Sutterellaceae bacterium]MDD7442102.1 metallophosphoesterase [Sutterellaceae bacterium]MDY2868111.1 metallophosphoesterase [Mesosutterella sp.]
MTEGKKRTRRRPRPRGQQKRSRPAVLPEIFFCGDPHGDFTQINMAAREHHPDAMVILGDLQASAPLEEVLEEALAFTDIWWIPGNHDTDTDAIYDNIWKSKLAGHNLNGRVGLVAGMRIAGLGGVFRGQIWMPDGKPNYQSVGAFLHRVGKNNAWRGGLPRRHRSSIFPSVYENLARQRADILVTHEAPSCHKKGFAAIDRLAKDLHAKWLFNGHQHETLSYGKIQGCQAYSVGLRGIMSLRGEVVVEGQVDPKEAAALEARGEAVVKTEGETSILVFSESAASRGLDGALGRVIAQPWRGLDLVQAAKRPKKG